ncbi:response regulator [Colwelliaceae bacterium 6471]
MSDDELLFFNDNDNDVSSVDSVALPPWKILLVDDEPSIHQVTLLALKHIKFQDRGLVFKHCYSGIEAKEMMAEEQDIAIIFLDVVMETDHAGLDVARYVRDELHNHQVRIILRTGQPGSAPESEVINNYDINDYKTKTELTSAKLETSVISALRSYHELENSELLRQALDKILQCTNQLLAKSCCKELLSELCRNLGKTLPLAQKFEPEPVTISTLTFSPEQDISHDNTQLIQEFPDNIQQQLADIHHIQVKQSFIHENQALLYICTSKNKEINYLHLTYCNPIEEKESQLLLNLGRNIDIICNNIVLQETLENINTNLEEKVKQRTLDYKEASERAEQANIAKSNFLSNMSHEIRTPMNAILGFTQILARDTDISAQQKTTLNKVSKAGQHLLDIINDVLEISKIEAGASQLNLVDFELISLLADIGQMFQFRCEQKQLQWSFINNTQDTIYVNGDQGKIRQILINLLGNSVKFTDQGTITLTISAVNENCYQFEITDTGPGISKEEQKTLFTNFSQGIAGTEKGGTGLGLTISTRQIEMMGGELKLESELGAGVKFSFVLELAKGSKVNTEQETPEIAQIEAVSKTPFNALCVDDIAENREVLGGVLNSCGINVTYAENGLEAVNLIKANEYDVVYMDLLMPIMKGDEAIKIIREELNKDKLVCIAISAFSLHHEIEHYLSIGFDKFIAKPFSFSDIFKSLLTYFPEKFIVKNTEENDSVASEAKTIIDISAFTLPKDVLDDIKESAAINRSSHVKQVLTDIIEQSPEQKPYAEYLIQFIDNFDMEGLVAVLEEITHE